MELRLVNKKAEGSDVTTFSFSFTEKVNFIPGQFMKYTLPHENPDDRGIQRFFTISAAPDENIVSITTRVPENSSSFKEALSQLKNGEAISAEGPFGSFTYQDFNQPAVFMAGGIGITPFRSILVDLDNKNINAPITLIYASRSQPVIFKELFDSLALKRDRLQVVYLIDQPAEDWKGETGRITPELIKKYIADVNIPVYYVSGPKPMVDGMAEMLGQMGIDENSVKKDMFPGYSDF